MTINVYGVGPDLIAPRSLLRTRSVATSCPGDVWMTPSRHVQSNLIARIWTLRRITPANLRITHQTSRSGPRAYSHPNQTHRSKRKIPRKTRNGRKRKTRQRKSERRRRKKRRRKRSLMQTVFPSCHHPMGATTGHNINININIKLRLRPLSPVLALMWMCCVPALMWMGWHVRPVQTQNHWVLRLVWHFQISGFSQGIAWHGGGACPLYVAMPITRTFHPLLLHLLLPLLRSLH